MACAIAVSVLGPAAAMADNYIRPIHAITAPEGFAGVCSRYSWACARSTGAKVAPGLEVARAINSRINSKIRQISDSAQYGVSEYWTLPSARGGDCEDFVLMKKRALIDAGMPPDRLLIATVLDTGRRPHAVLVFRAADADYVLDNLSNRVRPWDQTGYSFIRMQDPRQPERWAAVLAGGVFSRNRL